MKDNRIADLERQLAESKKDSERLDWIYKHCRIEVRPKCEWDDGIQLVDRKTTDTAMKEDER
jgi:hypothetical protein